MSKYVRHTHTTIFIIVVICLAKNCESRSAAVSSYQHLNGINIRSDSSIYEKDMNALQGQRNEHITSDANDSANDSSPGIWKDLSLIYRIYQQCANDNLSICLKVKLLTGLEKVLYSKKALRIIDGVQFVKSDSVDEGIDANNPSNINQLPSEADIEATLPRNFEAKDQMLNNLIFKKIAGFLRDHTLQVKFPDVRSMEHLDTNSVEGRGKKKDKKGGGAYIMIPLLLGGTFVPIAYGALAMLAGKALIVSKLALVLASIIGIKKLLSGGGGKDSHEVVVSSGGHSGWGRDMDLAYSGWKPAKELGKIP